MASLRNQSPPASTNSTTGLAASSSSNSPESAAIQASNTSDDSRGANDIQVTALTSAAQADGLKAVHLDPPGPVQLPPKLASQGIKITIFFGLVSWTFQRVTSRQRCVRGEGSNTCEMEVVVASPTMSSILPTTNVRQKFQSEASQKTATTRPDSRYFVLGIFHTDESIPNEVILDLQQPQRSGPLENASSTKHDLFGQIRKGMRQLRPFYKRLFSLKSVSGFSLYQCDARHGSHQMLQLDSDTNSTMLELWRDFETLGTDYGNRWGDWVHIVLNNNSPDPAEGKYALQLVLGWSSKKLVVWGITPLLFSLAFGLSYTFVDQKREDFLTVVQTAWTIASYIVTAGALALAIAAAVTQISDR